MESTLSHTRLYFHNFSWLFIRSAINIPSAKIAMQPLGLMILKYCSHILSSGIIESHLLCVRSYGGSTRIMSILSSGISLISSKQSPLYTLFNSISAPNDSFIQERWLSYFRLQNIVLSDCLNFKSTCSSWFQATR